MEGVGSGGRSDEGCEWSEGVDGELADGQRVGESGRKLLEGFEGEELLVGRCGVVAAVELVAAGVDGGEDGCRVDFGQSFGGGEADADAGEAARAICHNDGCNFGDGRVVGGEEFAD